ncbi:MAG: 50S ribosomal protein L25 [Candidatus Pacebacteria bacterium]|jgi:large subunit ribosomal protein L25|nr:50S ribosomal protein L25 [Candidatus Paceibacterota bacterium]MDD3072283.1 50S ribosomal protein L25 [Candidatus Paceibacterota bacterium]MDD3728863.1 50S ribosomal protein L25 [Candidatus Paceibacterota bacterium]MDD4201800.1 50S ribosomal protein L25 [Candidatus Paceibacterota bacterium]MDD4467217.1 50S ribosomal protein L25 [Candidatus Paceibacterota bacterium]
MITLNAKKREKVKRDGVSIPAVVYGPKIETSSIEIDLKEFNDIYEKAGESTLVSLLIDDKKHPVLIHEVALDSLTGEPIHVDFYQPILDKEVEAQVPIVFFGESEAVKNLGGTIVKGIQEVEVKALPEKLPHEIKVDVSVLTDFEKEITIKDLFVGEGVKILREPDEVVANVQPPQKVEEELEKPVEEDVESVEKIKKEKEDEEKEPENS